MMLRIEFLGPSRAETYLHRGDGVMAKYHVTHGSRAAARLAEALLRDGLPAHTDTQVVRGGQTLFLGPLGVLPLQVDEVLA